LEINMNRLPKLAPAIAVVGFALLQAVPAHAGNIQQGGLQVLDPSGVCASWTWGGTPAAPTLTCVAATPPTPGAPVCTITANNLNPLTISAAGTVALNATCTNTDANTTWAWTGTGASPTTGPGVSPQTQSFTVSATTTFSVVATNATGPSASKSVVVTVGAPPPPPPPPPPSGAIQQACAAKGYNNVVVVDMPWASQRLVSNGFGGDAVLIVTMTPPAGKVSTSAGGISLATNGSADAIRNMTLTTNPCDFSPPLGGPLWNNSGYTMAPSLNFTVGGAQAFNAALLQPGVTYYLSVRHQTNAGAPSCASSSCDVNINFAKAKGT
jgi:hypothetical protein